MVTRLTTAVLVSRVDFHLGGSFNHLQAVAQRRWGAWMDQQTEFSGLANPTVGLTCHPLPKAYISSLVTSPTGGWGGGRLLLIGQN